MSNITLCITPNLFSAFVDLPPLTSKSWFYTN